MSFSAIRRAAKQSLQGFWIGAIAVYAVTMAASLLVNAVELMVRLLAGMDAESAALFPGQWDGQALLSLGISAGALLVSFFLLTPFQYGRCRWHRALVYGEKPAIGEAVRPLLSLRQYGRTLKARLLVILHLIPWALLIFAPAAVVLLLGYLLPMTGGLSGSMLRMVEQVRLPLAELLLTLGIPFFLTAASGYALVPYLVTGEEQMPVAGAVRKSAAVMRGSRIGYVTFCCSFIGWWLLCILVLPILFVAPYFQNAQAMFLIQVLERDRQRQRYLQMTQEFYPHPETANG